MVAYKNFVKVNMNVTVFIVLLYSFFFFLVFCFFFFSGNSVEFKRCTGVKICSDRFRDILIAFFKFYANFDFRRYIISVFYGKAIDRPNDIENVHNKTSSGHSKNTDGVAIQDIFDHNKNISQTIPFQKIEKFQQICKESVEFLSEFGDSLRY